MHLSPGQLIDVVEGTAPESAHPHLQSCASCRESLYDLRATMASIAEAAGTDVPEPSPLFWTHQAARVRAAIAAEGTPARRGAFAWWRALGAGRQPALAVAGALAVAALAVGVSISRPVTIGPGEMPVASEAVDSQAGAGPQVLPPFGSADDPTLALVADLTSQMDADAAAEAGATNHVGGIDEAVGNLNAGERVELRRLLQEALAKPGA